MKNIFKKMALVAIVFAAAFSTTSCGNGYVKKCNLKNNVDSVSYSLGYFEAKGFYQLLERTPFDTVNFKMFSEAFAKSQLTEDYLDARREQFDTLDVESFKYGFHTYMATGKSQIDDAEANSLCQNKFQEVRNRKEAEHAEIAKKNLEAGQAFLAENAKKEGVVVLEDGLQYKIITNGTGAKPTIKDRVKVLYTGRLIDGTVFDSTENRNNEPVVFGLRGVIKAWTEALQLMPVGSKWTIYVPSELGYGERGAGENVPGNSVLVFDIELLEIVK